MEFTANKYMKRALKCAEYGKDSLEVPVGALIFNEKGEILAESSNRVEELNNITAHAEMLVIKMASQKISSKNLSKLTLVCTLEPCPMCASAISQAKIKTLIYAASDKKSGGISDNKILSTMVHHKPEIISGILEDEASELMKSFFLKLR